MATLHVSNVPDELYERLEEQARARRHSLDREVITLLQKAVREPQRSAAVRSGDPGQHQAAAVLRTCGFRRS